MMVTQSYMILHGLRNPCSNIVLVEHHAWSDGWNACLGVHVWGRNASFRVLVLAASQKGEIQVQVNPQILRWKYFLITESAILYA